MYYKEQLIALRASLSDLLTDLNREVETLPEGTLYVNEKGGQNYYSRRLPKAGNRKKARVNGITRDRDLVLALVRKTYVETAIANITKDLEELDRTIESYCPVASGGEMYISARLDHFGIPYRYEDETGIPDLSYAPDFTIMRPRDHKIIYWEHFGKVTDDSYVMDNISKVRDYIRYGIKPWDNLIMTFSNEKGGYDGKLIDAMIECWLL